MRTRATIAAPAEQVWATLTDFEQIGEWNPFVRRIEGTLEEGATLEIRLKMLGPLHQTIRPTIIALEPPRELHREFVNRSRRLLAVDHWFTIERRGEECLVTIGEDWEGALVPLAVAFGAWHLVRRGNGRMLRALRDHHGGGTPQPGP